MPTGLVEVFLFQLNIFVLNRYHLVDGNEIMTSHDHDQIMTRLDFEYLTELCRPVSSSSGRQSLHSASRGDLIVPTFRLQRSGYRFCCLWAPCVELYSDRN